MDIKYESLSSKNPDTKRLLSHVLRTVKLDKSAGVDFSGERLFVEAFPRPDGGCMLYISCLLEDRERAHSFAGEKRTVRLTARNAKFPAIKCTQSEKLLCRFDSIKELDGVCKSLSWQKSHQKIDFISTLYSNGEEYRLFISSDNRKLTTAIVLEYGELLVGDNDLSFTCEHYNLIADENAVEKMTSVL
jgi:hypothetical protein